MLKLFFITEFWEALKSSGRAYDAHDVHRVAAGMDQFTPCWVFVRLFACRLLKIEQRAPGLGSWAADLKAQALRYNKSAR